MNLYVLCLLLGALLCAMHTGATLARENQRRAGHTTAMLIFCGAVWSLLQAAWNTATDAESALRLMRLSAIGWVPIPVLAVHLVSNLASRPPPWVRTALPWLYVATGAVALIAIATPWSQTGAVKTSWGWHYELGPGFFVVLGATLAICGLAVLVGVQTIRAAPSPAERTQIRWFVGWFALPIVVGSVNDGILPALGYMTPPIGCLTIACLGAVTAWSFRRYGYSVLVPTDFAHEILGTLPDGVALLHHDGRIRSANAGLGELVGCAPSEVEGLAARDVFTLPLEELTDEVRNVEGGLRTVEGSRIPVSISTTRLVDRQQLPIGMVVFVHDLREVVDLRNRLVISGRLAAVGQLAAGVAHEINNPITYVRANLSQLGEHWQTLRKELHARPGAPAGPLAEVIDDGDELIEESLEGVDRAAAIVRDIKNFSHAGGSEHETADLNPLLESVLRVAAPQLSSRVRIERDFRELPLILCAPQELKQVFLNLVLNAAHAVGEDGGSIRVGSEVRGDQIVVHVEDDGCGIDPDVLERIFDPFFTTKNVGEGTGLGLSICHEIVRSHDGEIEVDSQPGRGSHFRVCLPVTPDAEAAD